MPQTDDIRISGIEELLPPQQLLDDLKLSDYASDIIVSTRETIQNILQRKSDKLLVIVGPCSIHDPASAIEYAERLSDIKNRYRDELEIVMRVYFEKPRTTVGWKGLINDPHLDGSFKINEGLRIARSLLCRLNDMGVPAATEFLDMITPQYFSDLISWGAIGARTTESQIHRELASGLSCPVGFKNGTNGNIQIAIDAIKSSASPHHFPGVTKSGHSAIVKTNGNPFCHIILRGGRTPNYDKRSVSSVADEVEASSLIPNIMIDISHGNSQKDYRLQPKVAKDVCEQISRGDSNIIGMMIESHLYEGKQPLEDKHQLSYGKSITDACINWDTTQNLLSDIASAVSARRKAI